MPSRFIKDSICTSESIGNLTWFEESLFMRLILSADDFGRYYGNPTILRGRLFPMKLDSVKEKDIVSAMASLQREGMIHCYEVDGKQYLLLCAWMKYQKPRANASKFPDPQTDVSGCLQMQTSANKCKQVQTSANKCKQGEAVPGPTEKAAEGPEEVTPAELPVIEMLLRSGKLYPVMQADIDKYAQVYGDQTVRVEMLKMKIWLEDNPVRRKTKDGMKRFISSWLSRSSASPATPLPAAHAPMNKNPFEDWETDWRKPS